MLTIIGIVIWVLGLFLYRAYIDRKCLRDFDCRIRQAHHHPNRSRELINLENNYYFGFFWPLFVVFYMLKFMLVHLVYQPVVRLEDFLATWRWRKSPKSKPGNYRKNHD